MGERGKRWIRRGVVGLTTIGCLALAGLVVIYWLSDRRLNRLHYVEPTTLPVSADTARGAHLATSVTLCIHCHGPDLGGQMMTDNPVLRLVAPNLTAGHGGVGRTMTDADFERAIRHGIGPDGRALLVMPADAFTHLSDADLSAIIAYIRSRPEVHREMPASTVKPLGRLLVVAGKFDEIPAERIGTTRTLAETPVNALALGSYLTDVSGCSFCHQKDFGGRSVPIGPPGSPVIPAINSAALAGWTEQDFSTTIRTGRRPDGRELAKFMPWRRFAGMTDAEVHAIWTYLQSVPLSVPARPSPRPAAIQAPRRLR